MALPRVHSSPTLISVGEADREAIIDKLLTTGKVVAEIAEEFCVKRSTVTQIGRLADIDVVKRDLGLKLNRQAYDLMQQAKESKIKAEEMFRDSIREALAKRMVDAGLLHGMDPLELEEYKTAKVALEEIENSVDIPKIYDVNDDLGSTEDFQ